MNELHEIHDYWRKPNIENNPWTYVVESEPSLYLKYSMEWHKIPKESKILEIGCNVGRNLVFLYNGGYKNLTGIEISEQAVLVGKKNFKELGDIQIIVAPIEDVIKTFSDNSFDVVFTVAVLEHIHPDSAWIFKEMVRIAKDYIFTMEDETGYSPRHFPRDYEEIFEGLGIKQIYDETLQMANSSNTGSRITRYKLKERVFKK